MAERYHEVVPPPFSLNRSHIRVHCGEKYSARPNAHVTVRKDSAESLTGITFGRNAALAAEINMRHEKGDDKKMIFFSFSPLRGKTNCDKISAFLTTEGLSDSMSRPRKLGITKVGLEVEGSKMVNRLRKRCRVAK